MTLRLFIVCLAAWLSSGCMLFGGLRVEEVATSAGKPSNVAVYVSVTNKGEPVAGLGPEAFEIVEDNQEVPADQSKLTLLPRDTAAAFRALLLVDMSGAVTEGGLRESIASAAASFVSRAHKGQSVTVYAFDGGPTIRMVGEFPEGPEDVAELPELVGFTPGDASSNLNGAVVEALHQLDSRLAASGKPVRIGTLVVFARGPDLAGRVTDQKLVEALDAVKHQRFAISIKDVPGFRPQRIGEDGVFVAESARSLGPTFEEAGMRAAGSVAQHYLVSYCSPARAGKRRLRIEVKATDAEGKEQGGGMSTQFDASGFGSGCDPTARPRFAGGATPAPAAEPEKPASAPEESEKPATKRKPGKAAPAPATKPAPAAEPEEGDDVVPPPSKPGYAQ